LLAHTFVLGHSKALWGADAEIWKPNRWLEARIETEKRELDEKLVSFSKGARGCIGQEMAVLMTAKAVVAMLKV
jgi:benzoate 4-monooxygenase